MDCWRGCALLRHRLINISLMLASQFNRLFSDLIGIASALILVFLMSSFLGGRFIRFSYSCYRIKFISTTLQSLTPLLLSASTHLKIVNTADRESVKSAKKIEQELNHIELYSWEFHLMSVIIIFFSCSPKNENNLTLSRLITWLISPSI